MEIEGKTFESNLKKYLNITFTTAKGNKHSIITF